MLTPLSKLTTFANLEMQQAHTMWKVKFFMHLLLVFEIGPHVWVETSLSILN